MTFEGFREVIEFAIEKEAVSFYEDASAQQKFSDARKMFKDFANEERKHQALDIRSHKDHAPAPILESLQKCGIHSPAKIPFSCLDSRNPGPTQLAVLSLFPPSKQNAVSLPVSMAKILTVRRVFSVSSRCRSAAPARPRSGIRRVFTFPNIG